MKMRRNFLLILFVLLLLGGCKKDKEVRVVRVQAETPDVTTTANAADISGTYSYASTLKSVVIAYGKDASLSSPQKVTAEHTRDSYSVTINDLESGTTYYYHCIFDTGYGSSEGKQWSFTTQSGGGGGGGRFSVSPTTTVEFAPGNLYWDGSAFRFEENQWSFASTWNPSHVSHFFWSKTASVAYASSYSNSGASTGDVFFTNGTQTTANPNFQVSGETAGTWRTLSKDEWVYLINTRTGNRFAKARVSGVKGLLIFPDGYNGTAISGITGIATVNSTGAPYPSESIPTGTWASMESAGVVFLPAAGERGGTSLGYVGSDGGYWSSTCTSSGFAYSLCFDSGFDSGDIDPRVNSSRSFGYSVRLVR